MKPKHGWRRQPNGIYSMLKKCSRSARKYRYSNNKLRMDGKPMLRAKQIEIAWERYRNYLLKKYLEVTDNES